MSVPLAPGGASALAEDPPPAPAPVLQVTALSFNARWPGFASTKREAKPWSERCRALVASARAVKPDLLMVQELAERSVRGGGQAFELFSRLGWHYDAKILNAVGWDPARFDLVDTLELALPGFGQWPGRSVVVVKLRERATGHRLRIGSTHLAVATHSPPVSAGAACRFRAEQMAMVMSHVNDDVDDWPMLLGIDANSHADDADPRAPRALARRYGWQWPPSLTGIDAVLANFHTVIDAVHKVELGTASDHDGHVVVAHTTRP